MLAESRSSSSRIPVARFLPGATALLLASPVLADCPPKPIRIGWAEQPPFEIVDEKGKPSGFDLALLTTLLDQMGCAHQTEGFQIPWSRQLSWIESGTIDVIGSVSKTPERSRYGLFSAPYRYEKVALFVRYGESARFPLKSLHDIVDTPLRTLGIGLQTYYGPDFDRWKNEPAFAGRLHGLPRDDVAVDMLVQHHVDGVLLDSGFGTVYLRQRGLLGTRVEQHPLAPIETGGIQYLFSRHTIAEAFVRQFNDQLDKVKSSGQYEALAQRYPH